MYWQVSFNNELHVQPMQVITSGRRAFCCLHSSCRSFHAGCVHLQTAPAGHSVPQMPWWESSDSLLKSKLLLCFFLNASSFMHAWHQVCTHSSQTHDNFPKACVSELHTAFSTPRWWLGRQTIVVFEGDIPDNCTFLPPICSVEGKEFQSPAPPQIYFWNRQWNPLRRTCLQPAPVEPDCTQRTFKSLSAKSCVKVSSCSLQRASEGSHLCSRASFHSWWQPQMLRSLVPCHIPSDMLADPGGLAPNSAVPALETTQHQSGQPLISLTGSGPLGLTARGSYSLSHPGPFWRSFRSTILLLPLQLC